MHENIRLHKKCEECGSPAGKKCYDNCSVGGFNLIEWLAEVSTMEEDHQIKWFSEEESTISDDDLIKWFGEE